MRTWLATIALLAAGCSGSATPGTLGGPCRTDGTCLAGLVCVANECVSSSMDGSSGLDAAADRSLDADVVLFDGNFGDVTFLPDGDPNSPTVLIYHPGDGEIRMATSTIPFIGMAHDSFGTPLTGAQLVWTDSFGSTTIEMGTGTYVPYSLGTVGDHLITLTGIDSLGHAASDQILVTAQ